MLFLYHRNPASEHTKYQYDQDKDFMLLKFTDLAAGDPHGFLSFLQYMKLAYTQITCSSAQIIKVC